MGDTSPIERLRQLMTASAPADPGTLRVAAGEACYAAGWPDEAQGIPRVEDLTPAQRDLAEVLAGAPVELGRWAIPQTVWARRRWLGIEPPGVVDREVAYVVDGAPRRAPLWRALFELRDDRAGAAAVFAALGPADRLEAFGDLALGAYRVEPPPVGEGSFEAAGRTWAPAYADRLLAWFGPGTPPSERGNHLRVPDDLRRLVIRALLDAGIAIEPRWEVLVPLDLALVAALPVERREPVLLRELADEYAHVAIPVGLRAVATAPSRALVDLLIARTDQCVLSLDCPPRRTVLAELREALTGHPALQARVDEHLAGLPALPALRCTSKSYPARVDELTPGQRRMIELLGHAWPGPRGYLVHRAADRSVTIRSLDAVSVYAIADADGTPRFEAALFRDEDGAVCRVGTTESVVFVAHRLLTWNTDEPTVEALHEILHEPPDRATSSPTA